MVAPDRVEGTLSWNGSDCHHDTEHKRPMRSETPAKWKAFARFCRDHPLPAIFGTLGIAWFIGVQVVDGYHMIHFASYLPPQIISAIGALLFAGSLVAILFRWDQRNSAGAPTPVSRPEASLAITGSPAPVAPEYGGMSDLIERWSNDHFPGSAVARHTDAWNVVHKAKEDLKLLLRRAQFSRFLGSGIYASDQVMTDQARYLGTPHLVSYTATIARDVDLLRVFVDFSLETEHGQWTARTRILLAEFQAQTRGQNIRVPVLTEETKGHIHYDFPRSRDGADPRALKWGDATLDEKQLLRRFPRPPFCRARLVLKGEDRGEQYYYFVLITPPGGMPSAVDQRNLEFPDQWFAEDLRRVS